MKMFLIIVACCMRVLGADDVAVTTTVIPHPTRPGQTTTKQVFTRGGHTNLVCVTTSRDGVVISRLHRFYHDRRLVADHMILMLNPAEGSHLTTTAGFSLSLKFDASNQIAEAFVGDRRGKLLEAFTSTNGVLAPVCTTELEKLQKSLGTWGEGQ